MDSTTRSMRLPDLYRVGGHGIHRTGWPAATAALLKAPTDLPILIDDFVERTLFYPGRAVSPWKEPWIGIFHHPPVMPEYFQPDRSLLAMAQHPWLREASQALIGTVGMTREITQTLARLYPVPSLFVPHPGDRIVPKFSMEAWYDRPTVVHVGWYLRNQAILSQIDLGDAVTRIHIESAKTVRAAREAELDVAREKRYANRPLSGKVTSLDRLSADDYDRLLARSVVVVEFLGTVGASNTVVDCIARTTPIVVNRLSPLFDYLGVDYPLYYDAIDQIPSLVVPARIAEAHRHLKRLPTDWLDGDRFAAQVAGFVDDCAQRALRSAVAVS